MTVVKSEETQRRELRSQQRVVSLLSEPYRTNHVLLMVRREDDLDAHIARAAAMTAPLNVADAMFREFCRDLWEAASQRQWSTTAASKIEHHLHTWERHAATGSNLLGCDDAQVVARELEPHIDIAAAVCDRPEIGRAFVEVPSAVRELVRVNFFVPGALVAPTLDRLLADDGAILAHIDRIEVAALSCGTRTDVVLPFPTLILYLGLGASEPTRRDVESTIDRCLSVGLQIPMPPAPNAAITEYALPILSNATVSQGYRLHKRYLAILGLLDEVFDRSTNHALVRLATADDVPFCVAIRDAVLRRHDVSETLDPIYVGA